MCFFIFRGKSFLSVHITYIHTLWLVGHSREEEGVLYVESRTLGDREFKSSHFPQNPHFFTHAEGKMGVLSSEITF